MGLHSTARVSASRARRRKWETVSAVALIVGLAAGTAVPASAQQGQAGAERQEERKISVSVPAQDLNRAILAFADQAGIQVFYELARFQGLASPGVSGSLTVREGLDRLLAGTGVIYRFTGPSAVSLERVAAEGAMTLDPVTVEGQAAASAAATAAASALPPAYSGGQVASGGQVGLLGNRDVMDTPFSTTNYTQELIQNQQARSIADVIDNDPSVRNAWSRASYADQYTIRGFPVNNDDVSYGGLYGILPRQTVAAELAERIEVLHGPNALLSGMVPSGTVGGAINVVPKHADDKPLTQITESFYSDGQFGTHLDYGRRFGTDNAWGMRVNLLYRNGETAVDEQSQELGLGTVGLDYRGERLRVSADAGHQRQDYDAGFGQVYLASGVAVPAAPSSSKNFAQSWGYAETVDTFGMVRAEYDVSRDVTVYGAVGARNSDQDTVGSSATIINDSGDITYAKTDFPYYQNNIAGEMGVRAKATTGSVDHALNAVYSRFHQEDGYLAYYADAGGVLGTGYYAGYTSNIYTPTASGSPIYVAGLSRDPSQTSQVDLTSFAVADTLSVLDDRVQLTLGARHQRVQSKSFDGGTGAATADYDSRKITPAVGIVVKPWGNVSLYGNYIEGLSQGGTAPSTAANAGEVFAPSVSKQIESGVKVELGGFTTTAALFQITKASGITDPDTLIYAVDGKQRNRGVELGTFGEVAPGVRLLGGVTLIDSKLVKTAGGVNEGNHAIGVPEIQANLGAEWDTPFLDGLTLNGRMIYTGSQYYDAANTQKLPDWTRFDMGARYKFEARGTPITVRAAVENVFGQDYWAAVGSSYGYLTLGAPRTYMLSTTFDF